MSETSSPNNLPVRPMMLGQIAITGVLAAGLLGAVTNMINGLISPYYFVTVMRCERVTDIWRAAVAQGLFEGLCFGLFFSLVLSVAIALVTQVRCSYGFAVRHLCGVMAGALACWAIGGLAGMALAAISPDFFRQTFREVPTEFPAMLAFAWVGGSIWGIEGGGLMSVVLGIVILRANWQTQHPNNRQ